MNLFRSRLHRVVFAVTADPQTMKWWRWLLAGLVVTVIWLALSPAPPESVNTGWDKLNHAIAFTALTITAILACPRSPGFRLLVMVALLGFGGLIEIAQSFTPTRSAEWGDLLADSVGMAAGTALAMLGSRLARFAAGSE